MAHTLQERYSELVDAKLRTTLIKKDGVIFNNKYEGNAKAGAVKIPVRDVEAEAQDYDKANGAAATQGTTEYVPAVIDQDKAVNEIIDGYDAASVPDNIVADRLDSATYSLGLAIELHATEVLESSATDFGDNTAVTESNAYKMVTKARTKMSKAKVPNDGRRWLLVSPDFYEAILNHDKFTSASNLGDAIKQTGAVGRIAGFLVFEDITLSETTDFIAGHPDWCCRVKEWQVPVHIQDLSQSGKFIGACAAQGRKVFTHKVTKPATLFIKKNS